MASKELQAQQLGQDVDMQAVMNQVTGAAANGKKFFPKKFGGIQKSKPLPAAIRKKRINFRLRKLLSPKSPLMVVNEMVGSVTYNFIDAPPTGMAPGIPHLFTAQAVVEGSTFSGTGPSKQIAKNICAEHVIQHVVTKKCNENRNKTQLVADPNAKPNMEEETPWLQLASLALFKLFNDWQAQGYVIPAELLKNPNDPNNPAQIQDVPMRDATPKAPKQAKKVPDNPTDRHPVQLLNELRGGVVFTVAGTTGVTPNIIFTMGCEIDGTQYQGVGRNKKDAKKHCAMEALKVLYNIQYPGTLNPESSA
jgi:hypothetical protein